VSPATEVPEFVSDHALEFLDGKASRGLDPFASESQNSARFATYPFASGTRQTAEGIGSPVISETSEIMRNRAGRVPAVSSGPDGSK
jgi:hypothetical protein